MGSEGIGRWESGEGGEGVLRGGRAGKRGEGEFCEVREWGSVGVL